MQTNRNWIGLVIVLVCVVNGIPRLLPWPEAHAKLWELNIGWVVPVNWLRYRLGRHKRKFFLDELDEFNGAEQEFLYQLVFARCRPVIEDDMPGADPDIMGIPRQGFVQRRCRCSIFPPSCDPIEVVATMKGPKAVNGYLLRRGITSIMVLGVHGGGYFPWPVLLEPPSPKSPPLVVHVEDLLKGADQPKLLPPPEPRG